MSVITNQVTSDGVLRTWFKGPDGKIHMRVQKIELTEERIEQLQALEKRRTKVDDAIRRGMDYKYDAAKLLRKVNLDVE